MSATLKFIGHINTPYKTIEACPNNIDAQGPICRVTLNPEYQNELRGLDAGQHILILYWLDNPDPALTERAEPLPPDQPGTFALRTPFRPNPIGAAVLPIEEIGVGEVLVRGLDCLDGTPLLDIKPAIYGEGGV